MTATPPKLAVISFDLKLEGRRPFAGSAFLVYSIELLQAIVKQNEG